MRIGELARRSAVPARMLRYYEQNGIITPNRLANGYRDYDEYLVDRVAKIRGLLDAGLPLRIIGDVLPCLDKTDSVVVERPDPQLREMLARERDRMTEKLRVLTQNRDAITRYIAALDDAEAVLPRAS